MAMNSFHARSRRLKATARPAREPAGRARTRVDQLLVERGLAESRTAAQRLIAEGRVSWRTGDVLRRVTRPSEQAPPSAEIAVAPATP